MSVDVFPNSKQGAGTVRVQYVPLIAIPTQPTLAELTGTDTLNASPYFRASDFQINHNQARIDDTRLSDEARREQLGQSEFTAESMTYIHQPQGAADAADNKAYDAFTPGGSGFFVVRFGPKAALAFAATQRVQVYAVNFGDQHQPIPTGDNAVHVIQQPITLTRLTPNCVLAAA